MNGSNSGSRLNAGEFWLRPWLWLWSYSGLVVLFGWVIFRFGVRVRVRARIRVRVRAKALPSQLTIGSLSSMAFMSAQQLSASSSVSHLLVCGYVIVRCVRVIICACLRLYIEGCWMCAGACLLARSSHTRKQPAGSPKFTQPTHNTHTVCLRVQLVSNPARRPPVWGRHPKPS